MNCIFDNKEIVKTQRISKQIPKGAQQQVLKCLSSSDLNIGKTYQSFLWE